MGYSKDEAVTKAQADLARRLGVPDKDVTVSSVERADFPDMALGASVDDEMGGQMITSGWKILLGTPADGTFEYRANEDQVRAYNFRGANYRL